MSSCAYFYTSLPSYPVTPSSVNDSLYCLSFSSNKAKGLQLVSFFDLFSLFSSLTVRSLVSHGSSEVDEVFLESCMDILSPTSPTTTIVVSLTSSKFAYISLDDDEKPVSDEERLSAFYPNAGYDFYGTPSGALCVYKTGQAWPVRTGPESQRIIREARGVHDHPMQPTWPDLGRRVCGLLNEKNVVWTSVDCLAFAEAGETRFSPLLIWIGVEPKSLAYELANTAAEAITYFINEAGFNDFEIGFRESVVTHSAGPKMLSFDPLNDSVPEFREPFTPTLGLFIAPFKTPHYEGTGALYLRESSNSKRVFLITCAHVARPPPAHPNTGLARRATSHPREQVIALGSSGYTNALKSMMSAIGDQERSIKDWETVLGRLGEFVEGESPNVTKRRNEHLRLVEDAKVKITEINTFHDEISKRWTIPEQRVIGEVIHVEPIAANVAPHGLTRDWALIELYDDKFDWSKFKGNKIYVGTFSILARIVSSRNFDCP